MKTGIPAIGGGSVSAVTGIGAPPVSATANKFMRVPFRLIELAQNTAACTDGQLWLQPIPVVQACTLTEIHSRVDTTAGSAGSTVRVGVYPLAAGANPLYDSGAMPSTTPSVTIVAAPNLALSPGWYLIAQVWQGNPVTKPTTRQGNGPAIIAYDSEQYFAGDGAPSAYSISGVNGALPTLGALTPQYINTAILPIVGLKFA